MKYALEYPGNRNDVQLNAKIEMIINEDNYQQYNRNYRHQPVKYFQSKKIEKYIHTDQEDQEQIKCDQILEEIEKIMRAKQYMSDQEEREKIIVTKSI